MTNFEYYSTMLLEDIEHYESENKDSYEILSELFNEGYCTFTKNDQTYIGKLIKWLKQEYRPPYRLTRFEKEVLENLNKGEKYIFKNGRTELIWTLNESEGTHFILSRLFPKIEFKCLEYDKKYKIADILGNCEVINVEEIGF